jgi:hypothetical protein
MVSASYGRFQNPIFFESIGKDFLEMSYPVEFKSSKGAAPTEPSIFQIFSN